MGANYHLKFTYFIILLKFILSSEDEEIYNIKDFRSNPLGIAQREDLFHVHMGVPNNTRVLAYADFNNDK